MNGTRRRKILLISYHFPPDGAVGGLRAAKVARHLAEAGHVVHVIAGPFSGEAGPADFGTMERVPPSIDLRGMYVRLRGRLRGRPGASTSEPSGRWTLPRNPPRLKRWVSSALWLPDDRQGWVLPVVRRGMAKIREGYDVIYTTAPPFSTLLAGLILKKRTGVTWVAEFRDPWTDSPWKPEQVRSAWSDALERRLERACLSAADRVVAVTEAVRQGFAARVGTGRAERVVVVRNGIDRMAALDGRESGGRPLSIAYLGTLYHSRDPRPFLRALAHLKGQGKLGDGVRVEFVGDSGWFRGESIAESARAMGLAEMVQFRATVSHEEAIRLTERTDLLLLLAQNQPLQVPNKLYEYLGARRPIIAFADADGETAAMLRSVGGHHLVTPDMDGDAIASVVERALASCRGSDYVGDEALLSEWSAAAQLQQLERVVRSA